MIIKLTRNMTAEIDEIDSIKVLAHKWYAGKYKKIYYALTYVNGSNMLMHTLIMGKIHGREIDHINNNGLDNRRCNLRFVTRSQNIMNRRKFCGTSIYKGVYWRKSGKIWEAQIKVNKISHYLGVYKTQEDAAKAYNAAAIKYFGEYAWLNNLVSKNIGNKGK